MPSNAQGSLHQQGNGLTVKKFVSLILSLVLVFSLAGCGAKTDTNKDNGDVKSTAYVGQDWSSEYYDESMKGTTLNLYGVTDNVRPIVDVFQEDTGIKVEHLTMQNGEILQRLENEGKSGVSIADLWFTGGADTFINASQKDILLPY
jgi:iron(III) transport system substrate-binding protein